MPLETSQALGSSLGYVLSPNVGPVQGYMSNEVYIEAENAFIMSSYI